MRPGLPWSSPACDISAIDLSRGGGLPMIITTIGSVDGRQIASYLGIVGGEAVMGSNFVRDFFASVRDTLGGRSGSYQKELRKARALAIADMKEEAEDMG